MRKVLVLVLVAALTGCGSHSKAVAPPSVGQLKGMVLQPRDLPNGYTSIGAGAQNPFTARSTDPKRYGRTGGWFSDYRRSSQATSGALIVQSRVDVFKDSGGARQELDAERALGGPGSMTSSPKLGDQSFATKVEGTGRPGAVIYTFVWRIGNKTGAVVVTGLRGKLALPQAEAIAERAAARLRGPG